MPQTSPPALPVAASPTMVLTFGIMTVLRCQAAKISVLEQHAAGREVARSPNQEADACRRHGVGLMHRAFTWPPLAPTCTTPDGRVYELSPALDEARDALNTFCSRCRLPCDLRRS